MKETTRICWEFGSNTNKGPPLLCFECTPPWSLRLPKNVLHPKNNDYVKKIAYWTNDYNILQATADTMPTKLEEATARYGVA